MPPNIPNENWSQRVGEKEASTEFDAGWKWRFPEKQWTGESVRTTDRHRHQFVLVRSLQGRLTAGPLVYTGGTCPTLILCLPMPRGIDPDRSK
ncbi:hypothetical protein RRG08_046192 [Elysia crispata]|uniref:Uncharacterized protein n=1 Tax=Elysia crispata TaxID=231223 RepID=A0AAE0XPF7_9GAST|nr:hypothetical protein RRG08_046192 [Elysia crispata]